MSQKRIVAGAHIGPNYLCHLLAVARIVFNSDYADRYGHTVSEHHKDILRGHSDLILFGGDNVGDLTNIVVTLPMVANLATASAFEEYFSDIRLIARTHDIFPFLRRYRFYPEYLHPFPAVGQTDMRLMVTYRDQISELAEVIVGNFACYEKQVWPMEQPGLADAASRLTAYFEQRDAISDWEHLSGVSFERTAFYPELCSAVKDGPSANIVAYDRTVFYHDVPTDKLAHIVSHEFGTHLLYVLFREIESTGQHDPDTLYRATDALAMFLNTLVLETPRLAYSLTDKEIKDHFGFYFRLYSRNSSLGARDLLKRAVQLAGKV